MRPFYLIAITFLFSVTAVAIAIEPDTEATPIHETFALEVGQCDVEIPNHYVSMGMCVDTVVYEPHTNAVLSKHTQCY